MKRSAYWVVLFANLLFFVNAGCATGTHDNDSAAGLYNKGIVILYENDVHCAIDGYGVMERLRRAVGDTALVAVVSSGDFLQGGAAGALSRGQYIVDIMKAMRYDAVGLGNHEFDFGIPRQLQLLREAHLPITSANFRDVTGDSLVYAPYIIRNYGDRSIAFIGVVTPSTLESESYAFNGEDNASVYDLCQEEIYKKVQDAVDDARGRGADYVVVLSHLGEAHTLQNIDSHGLVAATHGIDAVLDGHTHSVVECCMVEDAQGRMVPVTQTGTQFANIGKLFISRSGGMTPCLVPVADVPDDGQRGSVQHAVDSIKALMAADVDEVVCRSAFPLAVLDDDGRQQVRYAETNAGNLVTDALREYTGAEVALYNGGGIRRGIDAGEIKSGDIVAMLPFYNKVGVIGIAGRRLVAMLEACCSIAPEESGEFPQVSGMRFTLHHGSPNKVSDVQVLDKSSGSYMPIDPDRVYVVASMDYIISGGGFHDMLAGASVVRDYDVYDTDVVIWYMRTFLNDVVPDTYRLPQGRIVIAD